MYEELEEEMEEGRVSASQEGRPNNATLATSWTTSWDEFRSMLNEDESAELEHVGLSSPQQLFLHRPHDRERDVFNPRSVALRPILQGILADLAATESNRYHDRAPVTFDAWMQSLNADERRGVDKLGVSRLEHLQYVRTKQMLDCHLRMIPNRYR